MSPLSYASATVPVRPDLPEAHTRAWERLAAAGAWWTGAERVAIAQAVRDAATCSLCLERKSALSPHAVDGQHAGEEGSSLPAAAVDAAHRIASDPARLTRAWFEKTQAAGVSDGHYIELVGVVVTIVSIDAFCRGIGVAPHALPQPRPGEPSRARPEHLAEGEAWVPMLTERNLAPSEADVFDGMKKTGNVLRALSLVPDAVRQLRDLSAVHYLTPAQMLDLTGSPRAIDRMQIELVAGRVSALRECFYWTSSHTLLLRASGENAGDTIDLHAVTDGSAADRSGVAHAAELVAFAEAMVGDDDAALAEARATLLGATSPEVLVDTAAVASNFERMVRIADSTGIPLDAPMEVMTGALREELGIDAFDSAANTQASGRFAHAAAQVAWPAMRRVLSAVGKLASRRL